MHTFDWLRAWMAINEVNNYNGITLEGFHAAVADGIAYGIIDNRKEFKSSFLRRNKSK